MSFSGPRGSAKSAKRIAARQRRLAQFIGEGTPPTGSACELLCEDHVGTYALPYRCHWIEGTWRKAETGEPVKAGVVAWREPAGKPPSDLSFKQTSQ